MTKTNIELLQSEVVTLRNALRRYIRNCVNDKQEKIIAIEVLDKLPNIKVAETFLKNK